jgi:hypothetical protein
VEHHCSGLELGFLKHFKKKLASVPACCHHQKHHDGDATMSAVVASISVHGRIPS